jgi:membrane-associated phospholipid phosphatase
MSIDAKRHSAAAAFVGLLILSVFWPAPVVSVNSLCCHASLAVDDLSFLGREAPSFDVVFWCVAGLVAIAIVQSGEWHDWRAYRPRPAREWTWTSARPAALLLLFGVVVVALIWRFLDEPATALAERLQSDGTEALVRYMNRFGGGMNPAIVIIFFILAGFAYRSRRWVEYGVAMALSGALAGILVQLVKFAVGRSRPELWLGAFHHARTSASSFPSGHTVGAFALAGVLFFASSSRTMRVIAFLLAVAVGVSRVFAFRHWTSDVAASALLGTFAAFLFTRALVTGVTTDSDSRP